MYHKLGPAPAGVRLGGLYVGRRLFAKQLSQLRAQGFHSPPYGLTASTKGNADKEILLTFDDGFENVLRHGLNPLARYDFRAIEFLIPDLIGKTNVWETTVGEAEERLMDVSQIREWLAAGHEIGSHTSTHPNLTQISLREAREEIFSSKRKLEDQFGIPIRHFCYPYGGWNPAVRDLAAEAGYETACTTDFGLNLKSSPPWELKRILARRQSISLKEIKARLNRWLTKWK